MADEDEGPQLVEKHVMHTERYVEVTPAEPRAPAMPVHQVYAPQPQDEAADDVESFLQSVTDDEEYSLRVDSLPDYAATNRFGRGARTVYRGEIAFNPLTYLRDIQMMYGPGDYRLTVFKHPGHRFKKRWLESLAAPTPNGAQPSPSLGVSQSSMAQPSYQVQQQPATVDPLENFFMMAKRFGELRKTLWSEPQREAPAIAQASAPVPMSTEDRVMESLLQLATKNEALASKLLSRYLGEPASDEAPWWASILKTLEPVLPLLVPRILAMLVPGQMPAQLAGLPPGALAGLPPGAFPGLPPGAFIPPPPPPPPLMAGSHELPLEVFTPTAPVAPGPAIGVTQMAEPFEDDAPQFILIDKLVNMLNQCVQAGQVMPAVVEVGAEEVRATLAACPDLGPLISMLITGTPDGALGMLAMLYPDMALVRANPVAIASIEALQVYLREGRTPTTPVQQ